MDKQKKLFFIPSVLIESLDEMNKIEVYENSHILTEKYNCEIIITAYAEKSKIDASFFIIQYLVAVNTKLYEYNFLSLNFNDALYNYHANLIENVVKLFSEELNEN